MTQTEVLQFMESVKWFGFRKLYWVIRRRIVWIAEQLLDTELLPTHKQSLIKRPLSRKLIDVYNGDMDGHNLNLTQYFLGFGLIHYSLVRNLQPKRVLCVGSRKGFIPAILALACKDNGFGQVDFVDAGYDEDLSEVHWSGIGFWRKQDPHKHFSKIGVQNFITTHVMTTAEYAQQFPAQTYQYIYIDGDHSYEGVKLDYTLFWPKLEKGGFMAFHDVVARGTLDQGQFGVWKFWKEISKQHSITFPFPKESGLGIIQKL